MEVDARVGAFLHGAREARALLRRQASHLALAVLDVAQDLHFLLHVLRLGNLAGFEPDLQFEQALLERGIVGVLLFRDLRQRAQDELKAREKAGDRQ